MTKNNYPKISVVTPSFNQGAFIEDTIQSVIAQNYPNYEHLIIDGASTDNTLEILKKYPHLKVVSEQDKGQSDAINKGFRLASGEIIAWINSDDTYLPGTFERVVLELDRTQGRHVIMGKCIFVDEDGKPNGYEHPSAYLGRARLLKVWKGHSIPQPAVFFYKEVLDRSGLLDEDLHLCMDYELFIRMSLHYKFHEVDQVFATYRLHDQSKSVKYLNDVMEKAIEISKGHWDPVYHPRYWNCAGSLFLYRFEKTSTQWVKRRFPSLVRFIKRIPLFGFLRRWPEVKS